MVKLVDSAFLQHLRGFVSVKYEITYHLPDFHDLLNIFVHERTDKAPEYPELHAFLNWWDKHIEGPIHSVRATDARLIGEHEMRHIGHEFRLN